MIESIIDRETAREKKKGCNCITGVCQEEDNKEAGIFDEVRIESRT